MTIDLKSLQGKIQGRQVINVIIYVILGWFFWNFLNISFGTILVPMVANNKLPFFVLHLYYGLLFLIVGVFIGLISKVNIWFPVIGTLLVIFFNLAIIGRKDELFPLFFNLMTFIITVLTIVGSYVGKLLRGIVKKKLSSRK